MLTNPELLKVRDQLLIIVHLEGIYIMQTQSSDAVHGLNKVLNK